MNDPVTTTRSGAVRGFVEEGQFVFLGIPYAAPPFGDLRFAAPAPHKTWDGTRDALAYGPTAPQLEPGWTIIPEPVEPGDDYLNLNVFTPDLGDARLPVLVWIHGGGFTAGCNRSPWYRGTRFARDGVVVVTIGYRLGIEGFLELEGAPANRALLDWIVGLEWVADNIASFGGDPSRVTIGGQSAGSGACVHLVASPRAKGLFRGAICQSGVADTRMSAETAEQLGRDVAARLGVTPTRDALASFTPNQIIEAYTSLAHAIPVDRRFDPSIPALKPFVDGEVIASHPMRAIKEDAAGASIGLIAGATAGELNGLARMPGSFDEASAARALEGIGLDADQQRLYADHIGATDLVHTIAQALTDYVFRVPVTRLLSARWSATARTFAYDFRWPSPVPAVGAAHCLDIPFAFDNLDVDRVANGLHGPNTPQSLADEMHRAWVRFVSDGDPGWPAHDIERRQTMIFDVPSEVVDDPLRFERGMLTRSRELPDTEPVA